MGAIASKPIIFTVESGLLAVARLIDVIVRTIDRVFALIISKCFSPSLYAHFYVTPPESAEAAVHVGPDGLTRVCTQDGVCYIPATRVKQHRNWRKRNQEDRLKKRMLRAEWAAAGLDVREMQRTERDRQKQKSSSNPILALKQLSRTTTIEAASTVALMSKRSSMDVSSVRRSGRVNTDTVLEKEPTSVRSDRRSIPCHRSLRALTSVREASHDHGAALPPDGRVLGMIRAPYVAATGPRKHKRGQSAPVPGLLKLKGLASVDAQSASRIGMIDGGDLHKCDSPTVDMGCAGQKRSLPSSPLASSPILAQPRPRRAVRAAFDIANITANNAAFTVDLTPSGIRPSSTPPVPFLPARTRTSFDLSLSQLPLNGRAASPAIDDDASSIRSRRSALGIAIARSTTPNTPPPYLVHLADRACKSRWESSAKERKLWKDEVKRMALDKVHEQHTAYRASLDLKGSCTPPASSSTTHFPG